MIDIIQQGFGFLLMIVMFVFAWESTKMVEEKKQRRRNGTHDYYDNPIGNNHE